MISSVMRKESLQWRKEAARFVSQEAQATLGLIWLRSSCRRATLSMQLSGTWVLSIPNFLSGLFPFFGFSRWICHGDQFFR